MVAPSGRALCGWVGTVVGVSICVSGTDGVLAERQAVLAGAYQRGREAAVLLAAGGVRGVRLREARAAVAAGDVACAELLESLNGLLIVVTQECLNKRLGEAGALREHADALSEARVVALGAIAKFSFGLGVAVYTFVAWEVRTHLKSLDFGAGGGCRPRGWQKVEKVASAMAASGVPVTKDSVMAHFVSSTAERIMEKSPELSESAVESLARTRLSKQSITSAIGELSQVVLFSGGCESLDSKFGADGESLYDTLGDPSLVAGGTTPATLVRDLLSTLSAEDVDGVLAVTGERVPNDAARSFSARHGVTLCDARAELRSGRARLIAPHAQFAALWSALGSQFDGSVHGADDVLDVLDAHRARSLGV